MSDSDIDMELKRLFDERLRTAAPANTRRAAHPRLRAAAMVATAAVVVAGAGVVVDVNSVAATNGVECSSFLTKLQVWAQSHGSDLAGTDHSAARAELAALVARSGCSPHDASHDASHTGPHH